MAGRPGLLTAGPLGETDRLPPRRADQERARGVRAGPFPPNLFVGDRVVWRLRETVFWENRDGFGSTSSLDFDRVLSQELLFRWGAVGTISEATDGIAWRNAVVLYRNLQDSRAVAGELFWRGETAAEVRLREYGARAIFRFPLRGSAI